MMQAKLSRTAASEEALYPMNKLVNASVCGSIVHVICAITLSCNSSSRSQSHSPVNLSYFTFLLVIPALFLAATSPSPNHRLALTSWMTLITCFPAITGALIAARIHGTVLSILFALAISKAPADHGLANNVLTFGCAGDPGCAD